MKRITISRFNDFLTENLQQADKKYFSSGVLTPEQREEVLAVTHGDVYTNFIASIVDFKNDHGWMNSVAKYGLDFFYNEVKNYNKNVFPIDDINNDLTQLVCDYNIFNAFIYRKKLIDLFNDLPSIAKRNLKEEIRTPRGSSGLEEFLDQFTYFYQYLSLINNRPDNIKNTIYKKVFKSGAKLSDMMRFINDKENLIGGVPLTKDDILEIVEDYPGCEIVYETDHSLAIEVTDIEPLIKIGCNSLWCFTYGKDYRVFNDHSTNGIVYLFVDFREKDTSQEFMYTLVEPLIFPSDDERDEDDEDDDSEEDINDEKLFNQLNYAEPDPIYILTNLLGVTSEQLEDIITF